MIHKAFWGAWQKTALFFSALSINTLNAFMQTSTGIHIIVLSVTMFVFIVLWLLTIDDEPH